MKRGRALADSLTEGDPDVDIGTIDHQPTGSRQQVDKLAASAVDVVQEVDPESVAAATCPHCNKECGSATRESNWKLMVLMYKPHGVHGA
jgi:hypothetical protein